MKNKKLLTAALALVLVCTISVAGTLAFLAVSQKDDKAVVNTFLAAGNGNIIEDEPSTTAPEVEDEDGNKVDLEDGFFLVESKVDYADAAYTLTTTKTLTNSYDKVVPTMVIPKDPALTVDVETGVDAYIFVKVIDTTAGNLTYTVASGWNEISVAGLGNNEKVYVYGAITTGVDGSELNAASILNDSQVVAADALTDADATTDAMELGELKFEAYACQAGGFTSAAAAFEQCFVTVNP